MKSIYRCSLIFLLVVGFFMPVWAGQFSVDVRPGPGVTKQLKISEYFASLKNSNLDTDVYVLDSGKPGAVALLLGGTHANELAGQVAAQIVVESCSVSEGKLIVIPYANRSAISVRDTRKHIPQRHAIVTKSGQRFLSYGDRRTDRKDQGIRDPFSYTNPAGYKFEKGEESRNLNRAYPGDPDGTPTEQLAYAIMALIKSEKVDFCLDMHEARTPDREPARDDYGGSMKRLAYTLVSHPRGIEIAAFALLALEEDTGINMKLDESNPKYRGLSHLEIGNETQCLSFLSESPNPGQDKWRFKPDVINDERYPIEHRVGMHLRLFKQLADSFAEDRGKKIVFEGLPEYRDLLNRKIGSYLN